MLVLPIERATYRSEGLRQRKDVGRDEQVGVFSSYRMPVDAFGCNRDFGQ